MKVSPRLPEHLRIINRDRFVGGVDKRLQVLMRMRTEAPGVHFIALFADDAEKYALAEDVGPQAKWKDLKQAVAHSPAGLTLTYIIPCAECPPIVIPADLPHCDFPAGLAQLATPPSDMTQAAAPEPKVTEKTAAAPEPAPGNSRAPFGFALEKKGIRLPAPEDKSVQAELELRQQRADFDAEGAARTAQLDSREQSLAQRESALETQKAELLNIFNRLDALRRQFLGQ